MEKSSQLCWIDYLRVLATFSVIFLHVSSPLLYKFNSISTDIWWTAHIYDSFVRFCVPIFFMISGYLILSKKYESIPSFLQKRFLKIIYPFMFWNTIYILYNLQNYSFEISSYKSIIHQFFFGASAHFWYIYTIIGIYLFFPIIQKWVASSGKKEIEYFLIIWLVSVLSSMPILNKYFPNFNLIYFSSYLGFTVLGYYIGKYKVGTLYTGVILYFIGLSFTIIGTFVLSSYKGSFYERLYDYLSPNVIIMAIGVFLIAQNLKFFKKENRVINFFSKYSYGIYLIHLLVIGILGKVGIHLLFVNPIFAIPVVSILCFLISATFVWLIHKLPYGKYIGG